MISPLAPLECDRSSLTRALYSTDASVYRVVPLGVVRPRSVEELSSAVAWCLDEGIAITPRGAGTSCAGNAVGPGVVIDTSRLTRIVSIDPDEATAVVEPGVVQSVLSDAAREFGLRFGPDPSTATRCTIGGMIGNNACGPRALGYGRTSDNLVTADVITGTGDAITLAPGAGPAGLSELVTRHLGVIRTEFGTFSRQISGYSLEHLLPEKRFDTARFFAGTEGTLGVLTGATVRLAHDEPFREMVALGYPTMADAADAMGPVLAERPTACEGLDRAIVDVVSRTRGASSVPRLPRGDGWLFCEVAGADADEVRDRAARLVGESGCLDGWVVSDAVEVAALWRIRSDGAGLAGVSLADPAYAGWEDAAVPPARLGDYLRAFDALLDEHHLHGLPYGHFGDGCVHCRIDFPLNSPGGAGAYRAFLGDAAALVASFGGSMSGEHGDGRARSELLPAMYSPAAINLFGLVKGVFDPHDLMNPGILVSPRPIDADLRVPAQRTSPLRLRDPLFAADVHRCSGVGKCVSAGTGTAWQGQVMCPSYQATGEEKDSTRGRARVLQEMVNGTLITGGWRAAEVHEALELCLSCKGCRRDCPTGIDMAAYKSRVLFESYRGRVRPRSHYALGFLPTWGRLVSRMPGLGRVANLVTGAPGVGSLVKWAAGVDRRRPMPRFRPSGNARAEWTRDDAHAARPDAEAPRVAVWVDSFTDAFEGTQLMALMSVLADAGFAPQVIADDVCCGLTWITTGQLDGARRRLRAALDVLAPLADAGIPIVGMEPSCVAVWRSDAPELLDDARVKAVAAHVHTLAEVLATAPGFTPPDLTGHTIVAQPHCHHASVLGWGPDAALLAQTGADVVTLGGCCGLAGNFGVERGHYETSVAVAEHDLLPALRTHPDAIVLTDGFSCHKQVSDLAGRDSMTLAQLLAAHRPTAREGAGA